METVQAAVDGKNSSVAERDATAEKRRSPSWTSEVLKRVTGGWWDHVVRHGRGDGWEVFGTDRGELPCGRGTGEGKKVQSEGHDIMS